MIHTILMRIYEIRSTSFVSAFAALSLAGMFLVDGSDARAREAEVHAEVGALIGVGLPEMTARPTLGGDVNLWWAPHPSFHLGLAMGGEMTVLPFGCSDAKPLIGERGQSGCGDNLGDNFTVLPRAFLGARFLLGPQVAVGALLGTTFVMAHGVGDYLLFPYPTAAVFVETRLGAAGRFGLRASLGYIDIAYRDSRGFLAPTLAFVWN